MRKMWEQAAGFMGKPFPPTDDKYTDGGIRGGPRPGEDVFGRPLPPKEDPFGRPLPPKPWTPGDGDRRKPTGDGDKYGGYGGKGPSPRPSKKPNTRPVTPPSMMHDKKDMKAYPSPNPPINKIDKTQSINHDNSKSYKPQNPKP